MQASIIGCWPTSAYIAWAGARAAQRALDVLEGTLGAVIWQISAKDKSRGQAGRITLPWPRVTIPYSECRCLDDLVRASRVSIGVIGDPVKHGG